MTSSPAPAPGQPLERRFAFTASALVLCISACKFLVHLYAGRHYGYFVDELYYLACSRHLDWGYVEQPPLIVALTWLSDDWRIWIWFGILSGAGLENKYSMLIFGVAMVPGLYLFGCGPAAGRDSPPGRARRHTQQCCQDAIQFC